MEMKCEESVQITDIFPTTDSIASTDRETTTEPVQTTEPLSTIESVRLTELVQTIELLSTTEPTTEMTTVTYVNTFTAVDFGSLNNDEECSIYQNGSQEMLEWKCRQQPRICSCQPVQHLATPAKESGFNAAAFIYTCVSVIGVISIFLCGLFFLCRWRFFKLYRLPDREISINCSETSASNESKFDSVTLNTTL